MASIPADGTSGLSLAIIAVAFGLGICAGVVAARRRGEGKNQISSGGGSRITSKYARPVAGYSDLIGSTPMMELASLSAATGCRILGKCEFMNPGGSAKDRVAKAIIADALADGRMAPGGTVYEGTVGSTGISLALVARAQSLGCHICMPDDVALEKSALLRQLGATVERVKPCSIIDKKHFVNLARERAEGDDNGVFADQFETMSNVKVHYSETGPEIWEQTGGAGGLDAFVMGSGTGGTLAGVARYIKEQEAAAGVGAGDAVKVFLADPQGSGLYNKVMSGVCYSQVEREGHRHRHQIDSIVEGVGLKRLTANFLQALPFLDGAFRASDQEAVTMARYLMQHEGLFLGSSSCVNTVAAVKAARRLGPGHTIVTLLCDSGTRHMTRFWSDDLLDGMGLDHAAPARDDLSWIGSD